MQPSNLQSIKIRLALDKTNFEYFSKGNNIFIVSGKLKTTQEVDSFLNQLNNDISDKLPYNLDFKKSVNTSQKIIYGALTYQSKNADIHIRPIPTKIILNDILNNKNHNAYVQLTNGFSTVDKEYLNREIFISEPNQFIKKITRTQRNIEQKLGHLLYRFKNLYSKLKKD